MSKVLIDGYNVLAQSEFASREVFVEALKKYQKRSGNQIVLFFDGTHQGTGTGDRIIEEHMEIIFSPLTITADEMMEEYIEKYHAQNPIVVSSDRRIQSAASAKNLFFLKSNEFLRKIQSSHQSTEAPPWLEGKEDESPLIKRGTQKKGNPRKKSKKDRKKAKALKKI